MCTRLSTPQVEKSFSVIKSVTDNLEVDIADADKEGIEYGISSELGSMETCNTDTLFKVVSTPTHSEPTGLSPNRYYMPAFHDYLKTQWMTCFGLWTYVLDMQVTQTKTPLTITQSRTDGEIEQVCVPDRLACVVVT